MTYANGRLIHDVDSHLMELDDCLDPWFDAAMRQRFHASAGYQAQLARGLRPGRSPEAHADAAFRAAVAPNILLRKNYEAHGAFLRADRPEALDLLGFASQLVFTTFCLGNFGLDQGEDMALCHAAADAHNRMLADFCTVDERLLATAYVPLEDFDRAAHHRTGHPAGREGADGAQQVPAAAQPQPRGAGCGLGAGAGGRHPGAVPRGR